MSLIQNWQKNGIAAFEALFLEYKDLVLRTAFSMLDDPTEAEDILQIVFVKVYKLRDKFKGDEVGFRHWLYRITINQCIDEQRQKHGDLHLEQLKAKGYEPALPFLSAQIEDREDISRAFQCLDKRQRAVVTLRYLHGLSYKEISQTLSIPLGTVKSRLNSAMKILQQELVEERE